MLDAYDAMYNLSCVDMVYNKELYPGYSKMTIQNGIYVELAFYLV